MDRFHKSYRDLTAREKFVERCIKDHLAYLIEMTTIRELVADLTSNSTGEGVATEIELKSAIQRLWFRGKLGANTDLTRFMWIGQI